MHRSLVTTVALFLFAAPTLAADWEKINEEDGVEVFSREIPGSDLVAFKGTTVMNEPLQKVLFVLLTNEHREEWVNRLYISTVLERRSPFDYVVYQAFELPVIMSNRDYVYRGRATRSSHNDSVILSISSIERADAPETIGVRANLINSRYVLTPIDNNTTRVEVEIHTDPKGWLPTWLINMIQKSWPLKTLTGLREQTKKPYVGLSPLPPLLGSDQ